MASTHDLEFKNCFGAVAGYVDGQIFCSCGKFGLALRLPEKTLVELFKEKGVKKLKYFPHGHIKKEYAVLPKRILKDPARFKKLVDASIHFAS
ncbi:MAG: TfoX/Sxy family protein [Nitrospinae bacterium]|nr:TfoX/Sxy family protein [Nitrospinota bacterium]